MCLPGERDGTVAAQKALSAVYRTGQRFGAHHLVDVLVGTFVGDTRIGEVYLDAAQIGDIRSGATGAAASASWSPSSAPPSCATRSRPARGIFTTRSR